MTSSLHLGLIPEIGQLWLFDLDGTLVTHNAYLDGKDELLPGVKEFFNQIPTHHVIIILTARTQEYRAVTEEFLEKNDLRFNYLLMGMPKGERILLNDRKPDGTSTAYAINLTRDAGLSSIGFSYLHTLKK
jgi:hypothetical protein